jgi:DNA repair protein RecO (recombination protein O)
MLAHGRDLWIVTQAETVAAYLALREDLERIAHASYAVELLDRFTYEEGANRPLFDLLAITLQRLNEGQPPFTLLRYYELRLLDLLGFRPELFRCVGCGDEIQPQDQFFSPLLGGVLCPRCGSQDASARPISVNALRFLRHFQRSTYAEATRAVIPVPVQQEMETRMQDYLTYYLERGLNTPGFLRAVRRRKTD